MTEPRADRDDSARIVDALQQARAQRRPVYITAGGSKRDLIGRDGNADTLDVSGHRGILDYQPRELVITARAGTPLAEIAAALDEQRQVLSFEPPLFAGRATLGGTLANDRFFLSLNGGDDAREYNFALLQAQQPSPWVWDGWSEASKRWYVG